MAISIPTVPSVIPDSFGNKLPHPSDECSKIVVYCDTFVIDYHSSSTIHHSSIIIPHFSFLIPHSSFLIHHSPFFIHHPLFTIPHSPFIIYHSSFLLPGILNPSPKDKSTLNNHSNDNTMNPIPTTISSYCIGPSFSYWSLQYCWSMGRSFFLGQYMLQRTTQVRTRMIIDTKGEIVVMIIIMTRIMK